MTAPPASAVGRRRGQPERSEEAYRRRMVRGAVFHTSRQVHEDLTIVVKRFPVRHEPRDADRAFVLVHGIGVSSRYFQPLAAELAHHGAVYLVDLPGYGAAPSPRRDVPIDGHAGVLASLLRRAGLEHAVLIGHSWGSQVVARLAEQHPATASRIVLMAPTIEPERRSLGRAAFSLLRDGFREPPVVWGIAITDYLMRCGVPYLLRQTPHMLQDALEARVGRLSAPVLVITGDRDPIASASWGRELAGRAPDGRFREVRGPHVIMHTDPVMVARHITGWLTGDEPDAGGAR